MAQERHNAYWSVVEDCLVRFHGMPRERAERRVAEEAADVARRKLRAYFHAEPFDSANDIAGECVVMDDAVSAAYDEIVVRHYGSREVSAAR